MESRKMRAINVLHTDLPTEDHSILKCSSHATVAGSCATTPKSTGEFFVREKELSGVIHEPRENMIGMTDVRKPTPKPRAPRKRHDMAPPKRKKGKKKNKDVIAGQSGYRIIGLLVDAMDRNSVWAEAKIVACDPESEKIKVTFLGWGRHWDLWTDPLSIKAHGSIVPLKNGTKPTSWDGQYGLFSEEMKKSESDSTTHSTIPVEQKTLKANKSHIISSQESPKKSVKVDQRKRKLSLQHKNDEVPVTPIISKRLPLLEAPTKAELMIDPATLVQRQQNVHVMEQNRAFLENCAEMWYRQLHSVTTIR